MSLRASTSVALTALILLLAIPSAAPAQSTAAPASLAGEIRDPSGAPVPSVTVDLLSLASHERLSTRTDAAGRYAFERLRPGRYRLSMLAAGFEPVSRDVVVSGEATTADLTLSLPRPVVLVEVTASSAPRPLSVETNPRAPRQPIPAHDGADYLKTIPGFSVIRKGGTDGDPVLRGMAGSRLGVLLDGEHILGGCGNRMDPPTAYAFPEAYDRITVLKGPQTVLHGPGNSAGVVLFERTRDRFAEPGLKYYLSPTLGAFGRNDQVADVVFAWRRFYMNAAGTRSAMDDYRDGGGGRVHSEYERWSTSGLFGWTPDARTRIELSGARSDGQAAYADRAMDGVRFARDNVALRAERREVSRVVRGVEAQVFYNDVDHVMDNYTLRTFTPTPMMGSRSVNNPERRTVGGRAAGDLQVSGRLLARVGVDWQENRHTIRSTTDQLKNPFEARARMRDASFRNVGLFGEATTILPHSARVVAGARVDRWSGHDGRRTISAGMAGAQPNPTSDAWRRNWLASGFGRYERDLASETTLYAGIGHSERAPDYWELVSKESVTSLSAFGTRPEQTTQIDAGLLFRRRAVSGSVAVFASHVNDFILIQGNYVKAGTTGVTGATPVRKATVSRNIDAGTWGAEATATWAPVERLRLDASTAYVRGRNETDDRPLAQLPPLEGRFGLAYAGSRWSAGALVRLVAAQERFARDQGNIVGLDLGPTARFAVFSANGGWRVTKEATLSLGIDNVFDTRYAEFISRAGAAVPGFTPTTRVNEPGQSAWVKLDLRR